MCYRSMEGEHKDKQTCEEIWGWEGDGLRWGMCYRSMDGEQKN